MPDQPFGEKDVLLRLPQDKYAFKRVFVKDSAAPFGVSMHWLVNDRWCRCQPTMHDVAELLRQLRESQARIEELEHPEVNP